MKRRSNTALVFWVACMFLLLYPLRNAFGVERIRLHPPAERIPLSFFGMHIHHLLVGSPERTPWPSVPFGSWRLWDAHVRWAQVEPEKNKWDFELLDKYVALAEKQHVDVLLTLAGTPRWASGHSSEKSYYGPGAAAAPQNLTEWQQFVETVATRYKGRIHEYEIWNEPNLEGFYTGSVPEMVQLARVAYITLKKVDPSNIVVSPSATGVGNGVPWLESFLKAGGGRYVDVIGYHFYVSPDAPEAMVPLAERLRQVMEQNGVGSKPLWDTETGWYIGGNSVPVKPHGRAWPVIPPEQASGYVARAYVLAWASGVSRLYWYAWDNANMGLARNNGRTPKAPAIAYGNIENWLVGARMRFCGSSSAGIWTCSITRSGNYRAWIVWRPDREGTFLIPKEWNVDKVRDLNGRSQAVGKTRKIGIGPLPVLLVSPGG